MIDEFNIKPKDYKKKIDKIITLISSDKVKTKKGVDMLRDLIYKY